MGARRNEILIAVDGSPASVWAIRTGIKLAGETDAAVTLLHVVRRGCPTGVSPRRRSSRRRIRSDSCWNRRIDGRPSSPRTNGVASAAGKEPVMSNTLCIENLSSHEGAAEVERLLKPFGPVRCAAMVTDPDMLRQSPGIALMEMPSARQARAAMAALDGMEYRGGTLRVRPAVAADFAPSTMGLPVGLPVQEPPWRMRRTIARATAACRKRPRAVPPPRTRKGACHDIPDHAAVDVFPTERDGGRSIDRPPFVACQDLRPKPDQGLLSLFHRRAILGQGPKLSDLGNLMLGFVTSYRTISCCACQVT